MAELDAKGPFRRPTDLMRLNRMASHPFQEEPDQSERAAIAEAMQLTSVSKMRFEGRIDPIDGDGWQIQGRLGATVVQPCVVTLQPVKTRIDVDIRRTYLPGADGTTAEVEIDPEEAEDIEDVPQQLDLGAIGLEELSLALPAYPRAEEVDMVDLTARPPGAQDIAEDAVRPFAGLASLRDSLAKTPTDED